MINELPTLLLMDEERSFTHEVTTSLKNEFRVCAIDSISDDGVSQLSNKVGGKPDLVILSTKIANQNGFEIFKSLKENYIDDSTPVIFTTAKGSYTEWTKAINAGAIDIIQKPANVHYLRVRLPAVLKKAKAEKIKNQELANSKAIAFSAMTQSSELGKIIQTLEKTFECDNFESLSFSVLQAIKELGLFSSIKIFSQQPPLYFSYDMRQRPVESELIDLARTKGRIFDFAHRSLFNYPNVTLFIRNMPLENQERYGQVKDIVCMIMNAVEARIKFISTQNLAKQQHERIHSTAIVLTQMMKDMSLKNRELTKKFEKIIEQLESDLANELTGFNLIQEEEQILMQHISHTLCDAEKIFEKSINLEKTYSQIMARLIDTLT